MISTPGSARRQLRLWRPRNEDDDALLVHEVADLWFHSMVLLQSRGLDSTSVQKELARRFGVSGLVEQASRRREDVSLE